MALQHIGKNPDVGRLPRLNKKNTKHYLTSKELSDEIAKCKELDQLSDKAARMFMLISQRVQSKLYYVDPYLKEECLQGALFYMCKYWVKYDHSHPSANAFAYFSEIAKRGLAQSWNKLYKHEKGRESLNEFGLDEEEFYDF